jgi:hypothetical protein
MAAPFVDEPAQHDALLKDRARFYEEFLENQDYTYTEDIHRMLNLDQTRLIVNLDDLRAYRRELADKSVLSISLFTRAARSDARFRPTR